MLVGYTGGGTIDVVKTRVRCAWGKFREPSPILTLTKMSLRMKGKIYRACVQSVLVYGSETWALKVSDTQQLERTERMMVRWMCGVSLKDRKSSQELLDRLGIVGVAERMVRSRLRWFGHVEHKVLMIGCRSAGIYLLRVLGVEPEVERPGWRR
jgi:hypothetical protein